MKHLVEELGQSQPISNKTPCSGYMTNLGQSQPVCVLEFISNETPCGGDMANVSQSQPVSVSPSQSVCFRVWRHGQLMLQPVCVCVLECGGDMTNLSQSQPICVWEFGTN